MQQKRRQSLQELKPSIDKVCWIHHLQVYIYVCISVWAPCMWSPHVYINYSIWSIRNTLKKLSTSWLTWFSLLFCVQLERLDSDDIPSTLKSLLSANEELQSEDKELQMVHYFCTRFSVPFLSCCCAYLCETSILCANCDGLWTVTILLTRRAPTAGHRPAPAVGVRLVSWNCFTKSVCVCMYAYLFVFPHPREQTFT